MDVIFVHGDVSDDEVLDEMDGIFVCIRGSKADEYLTKRKEKYVGRFKNSDKTFRILYDIADVIFLFGDDYPDWVDKSRVNIR